jgi:pyruvate formate-lyase/glycerol dehydratase family glycyl radical enzyme
MTETSVVQRPAMTERIRRLRAAVQSHPPGVCSERARIWTEYFRRRLNRAKPPAVQMAEALRQVLLLKSAVIHPDELIVGNFCSKRVGGSIYPELHGIPVLEDLPRFATRKTNPLQISRAEAWELLKIVPFWLFRFLGAQTYRSPWAKLRFILQQLRGTFTLINETGGISHLAPDYEKLVRCGTQGIAAEAAERQARVAPGSESWSFYEAVQIIAEELARFGERYAGLAQDRAAGEADPARRQELERIAEACRRVPRQPARSFHEALQSVFFAQIAINLESLDNAVCPGRLDQILWPYLRRDLESGVLSREQAKELAAAFSIKMCELIPVFSERITRFHSGLFNGQVVTVGGVDAAGRDATNELSFILLEVMDELRMRQPNFHARVHSGAPEPYRQRIAELLASGANSPALYNDDVIVPMLQRQGCSLEDARNYTGVGCVEPTVQGKSFCSTDAALVNVPILLELALNEGRRFGSFLRSGIRTRPVRQMRSMSDVREAFEAQLRHRIGLLVADLQAVELANRRLHPTPLTSMLVDGCLESGRCSTAGGAKYNASGVQCVGPVDTGDALYAIETAVFEERRLGLGELVDLLRRNLDDEQRLAYLRGLPKFGNDLQQADRWTLYVVETFVRALSAYRNTRGGLYVAGLYSVSAHQAFGEVTGAMAHGRKRGEAFASGFAPVNGMDRLGPTAVMNSVTRLDATQVVNGMNFNLKFDMLCLRGRTGPVALGSLLRTYFRRGGMQVQVNVLDPAVLLEARDHPERHPNLLVRVSGYSAYFNDLTPEMKDEIIHRTCLTA